MRYLAVHERAPGERSIFRLNYTASTPRTRGMKCPSTGISNASFCLCGKAPSPSPSMGRSSWESRRLLFPAQRRDTRRETRFMLL